MLCVLSMTLSAQNIQIPAHYIPNNKNSEVIIYIKTNKRLKIESRVSHYIYYYTYEDKIDPYEVKNIWLSIVYN